MKMRGDTLAGHLGWETEDVRPYKGGKREVGVLIKYDNGYAKQIRNNYDRLIWDPLDSFMKHARSDAGYWRVKYKELRFDDIIATSASCASMMNDQLRKFGVKVHLVKHQSDSRMDRSFYNVDGPVVYAGGKKYLGRRIPEITKVCESVGKEFVVIDGYPDSILGLKGASVAVCLREPPYDSELIRCCKPQVKMENAIACGIPIVASDHPCCRTIGHGKARFVGGRLNLKDAIRDQVFNRSRPGNPFVESDYLKKMEAIIHG